MTKEHLPEPNRESFGEAVEDDSSPNVGMRATQSGKEEKEIKKLREENTDLKDEIRSLKDKLQERQDGILDLQERCSKYADQLEDQRAQRQQSSTFVDNPKSHFSSTDARAKQLESACATLQQDLTAWKQEAGDRQREATGWQQEATRLQQALRRLNEEAFASCQAGESQQRELKQEINELVAELAQHRLNPEVTYRAGEIQPRELKQELEFLQNAEFHSTARALFNALCQSNALLKSAQRTWTARIRATLVQLVFIDEIHRQQQWRMRTQIEGSLAVIRESSLSEEVRHQILFEIESRLNKVLPSVAGGEESQIEGVFKDRIQSLVRDFKLDAVWSDVLEQEIQQLMQRSRTLVSKVLQTNPPGALWIAQQGQPFDALQHRVYGGYDEGGQVEATLYPGYSVGAKIELKAVIITSDPIQSACLQLSNNYMDPNQTVILRSDSQEYKDCSANS